MVDESFGEEPLVVVEPLGPLGDGLVLYLARLLSHHWRLLLPLMVSLYPEEASCIPHRVALSLYSTGCVKVALHTASVAYSMLSVLDFRCPPPAWSVLHFLDLEGQNLCTVIIWILLDEHYHDLVYGTMTLLVTVDTLRLTYEVPDVF